MMIKKFADEFSFLSNFWLCPIEFEGILFPSVEHAFCAAKTLDVSLRDKIRQCSTPGRAKRAGRRLTLRNDWESIKLDVMLALLRKKFAIPQLREALIATQNHELIEGNHWHDVFWGVCEGIGENHLGKLLMQVRDEINAEEQKKNQELDNLLQSF